MRDEHERSRLFSDAGWGWWMDDEYDLFPIWIPPHDLDDATEPQGPGEPLVRSFDLKALGERLLSLLRPPALR